MSDSWAYSALVSRLITSQALTRRLTPAVTAAALALSGAVVAPTEAAVAPRHISYRQWDTTTQLRTGTMSGSTVVNGRLVLGRPSQRTTVAGRSYAVGTWTSPWVGSSFGFTELVPSWASTTPDGTLIQVMVRGVSVGGRRSSWDSLGRWALGDGSFKRTSHGPQTDDLAHVATDTWEASVGGFRSWQLRVSLFRRAGTSLTPRVGTIGAMTSELPHVERVVTSKPGVARGMVLSVPRYSQMIHTGEYPKYGGGGEGWCSPTPAKRISASVWAISGARSRLPRWCSPTTRACRPAPLPPGSTGPTPTGSS